MTLPTATYRLQFRNAMTFDRAIALIPHWLALGISHIYASPIFVATKDSTHGYDIIDPNAVDPAIGGQQGFDRFSAALKQAELGLILDIVPNHLAASLENPWWRDIIEWGRESRYAQYFDVDWRQKLTLPVISGSVESEVQAGAFKLVIDAERASLAIDYAGSIYPLHPKTYRAALASLDHPMTSDTVALTNTNILDLQPWRFINWRDAPNGLSYRRFFEVTGLVGLRVEDPDVFDAVHRGVLDMVRRGSVDGLRIDHIDGLADPEAYLMRLREAVGPETYIVVEKILEGDEQLPQQWPINGTTGYEFIAAVGDVLVDHRNGEIDAAYRLVSPQSADAPAEFRKAKELMVDQNFRGEVSALQVIAREIADASENHLDHQGINLALRAVLLAFPVYRTYGSPRGLNASDGRVLGEVFEGLLRDADTGQAAELNFLHGILKGDIGDEKAVGFRTRMQHLTGPLLAKALEDTFFYRYNCLLALNEVGGDPLARNGSIRRFHTKMLERARHQPTGLTATSTHDTKRGEDARARLYTISEAPELWASSVERWRGMHAHLVARLPDGPAPEPNVEWMLYQALAGIWPPELDIKSSQQLSDLQQRFLPYVEKALREAKLRTDWADNNSGYEQAVADYASKLLSVENAAFLRDFETTLAPFIAAGGCNSLVQTLLKLTVPGIPDIYQGCEGLDFSLVDPDNRRVPDFERLSDDSLATRKNQLIASVLRLRKSYPELFTKGEYVPLEIDGPAGDHVIAFARVYEGMSVLVVVPRLTFDFLHNGSIRYPAMWRGTRILLAGRLSTMTFHNAFSGHAIESAEGAIATDAIFADQTFALAISAG